MDRHAARLQEQKESVGGATLQGTCVNGHLQRLQCLESARRNPTLPFFKGRDPLITPSFPCGGPTHWPERRLISNLLSLLLLLLLPLLATACWSWRPSALDGP